MTRTLMRSLAATLTAVSLALPEVAAGNSGLASRTGGAGQGIDLRRDGSEAVPFVADTTGTQLRRDGSKAVPFVADLETPPGAPADGFDWGDAAMGAGAAIGLMAAGGAGLALRRRVAPGRSSVGPPKPTST